MVLSFNTISIKEGECEIIDQTLLPSEYKIIKIKDYKTMGDAIKRLAVRGAPAIGIAGACGAYLGSLELKAESYSDFKAGMSQIIDYLKGTRPTAVNLFWALDEIKKVIENNSDKSVSELKGLLFKRAEEILEDDKRRCDKIGDNALTLAKEGMCAMTYCNAGALATGGIGTALSVFYKAKEKGVGLKAVSCETRPLLQGSRLTCWELTENGIDTTLITDNAVANTMDTKKIDFVIVGADRIALNGDTANKIGTCSVAINAKERGIPFYVAAPLSTFDFEIEAGGDIPIEERGREEVTMGFGKKTAPDKVKVYSPAFDVTPSKYITAIITEEGIIYPPFKENILKIKNSKA
jgi:methylthioribose-1-phosphate isomerase